MFLCSLNNASVCRRRHNILRYVTTLHQVKDLSLYGIQRIFLLQINEEGHDRRDAGEVKVVIGCGKFHRFTVHFDSLSFFTPTYALSHITMYYSFKLY
jgi:hypothetical protein